MLNICRLLLAFILYFIYFSRKTFNHFQYIWRKVYITFLRNHIQPQLHERKKRPWIRNIISFLIMNSPAFIHVFDYISQINVKGVDFYPQWWTLLYWEDSLLHPSIWHLFCCQCNMMTCENCIVLGQKKENLGRNLTTYSYLSKMCIFKIIAYSLLVFTKRIVTLNLHYALCLNQEKSEIHHTLDRPNHHTANCTVNTTQWYFEIQMLTCPVMI